MLGLVNICSSKISINGVQKSLSVRRVQNGTHLSQPDTFSQHFTDNGNVDTFMSEIFSIKQKAQHIKSIITNKNRRKMVLNYSQSITQLCSLFTHNYLNT